ncbi:hypothetical protein Nepgr_016573 [Nepenthes gracilis]|uniref:NAD(P)H dehydrogenase (quinone) n=1 Tax=Nepenthes gracilis TaxID=150966 RepID=A0AAD3SQP3_NEPGR|nr:hypothetical protein Nepgr_016573 [Nepenthes gracilis]
MGKGGGCFPSKKKLPYVAADDRPIDPPSPIDGQTADSDSNLMSEYPVSRSIEKSKIFIVFYSTYGHVEGLARRIKKGVDGVDGVEGVLYRVPETLPIEALDAMKAPPKDDSVPEISGAELVGADGILFGFPTRYGCMAAQMKAFFDSMGHLWKDQKLAGKPAGFFVSTGTQGGGQETTIWTAITQLAHLGMLFVPIGYTFGAGMFEMETIRGGTPYGAGVFAGDGTREPSNTELALAEHQGSYMAAVVNRLAHRLID